MTGGRPTVAINGRYVRMHTSGVQRYAQHLVAGIFQEPSIHWRLLVPPARHRRPGPADRTTTWSGPQGHAWDQAAFPVLAAVAGADLQLNLCNWGPVGARRQVVALHDVATFLHPQYFERSYATWHRTAVGLLVRRGATIVTPSDRTRRELAEHVGIAAERVAVVPPGVASRFFVAPVPATRPYCLLVGAHDPRKNARFLIDLWPAVHARTGLELHVVVHPGSRPHGSAGSVPAGVTVHAGVPDGDLVALYRSATVVLSPSIYEGFGLPLLEAMAGGVPFVSSATGAAEELAVDPRQVVPLDAGAWVDAIEWVSTIDDRSRQAMVDRARAFSWERSAAALVHVVRQAL